MHIPIAELIDRLQICNLKLFKLQDKIAVSQDALWLAKAAKKNVSLCEERSILKNEINERLGDHTQEVKTYGK